MTQVVDKKVKLKLVGVDGNAFSVMGAFSEAAKKQSWTKEEINKVTTECMSGDYDHLLQTIMAHVEDPFGSDEDEDDDFFDDLNDFEEEEDEE